MQNAWNFQRDDHMFIMKSPIAVIYTEIPYPMKIASCLNRTDLGFYVLELYPLD